MTTTDNTDENAGFMDAGDGLVIDRYPFGTRDATGLLSTAPGGSSLDDLTFDDVTASMARAMDKWSSLMWVIAAVMLRIRVMDS